MKNDLNQQIGFNVGTIISETTHTQTDRQTGRQIFQTNKFKLNRYVRWLCKKSHKRSKELAKKKEERERERKRKDQFPSKGMMFA